MSTFKEAISQTSSLIDEFKLQSREPDFTRSDFHSYFDQITKDIDLKLKHLENSVNALGSFAKKLVRLEGEKPRENQE